MLCGKVLITARFFPDIKEIFELFAIEEDGIDAVDLGDILRALKLNPSLKVIETMGGKTTKGMYMINAMCLIRKLEI